MSFYIFMVSLTISLAFTACTPSPQVPLSPELSQYAPMKEHCEALRTTPGILVPDELDKECLIFLNRLDKANALDYKIAHFNDGNTDPNARPKPEYILLQTDGHRQHLKSKLDYQELVDTLNRVSLEAITKDELADVELTLSFPGTAFTKEHYLYYKKYAPKFDEDPQYLAFEKQYAEELIKEGLTFLNMGDKHSALALFKEAAALHSAQAEYLVGLVYEAKHVDKAIAWYTEAEAHGIVDSRLRLARLYSRNHEPKESQKWYHAAAEGGDIYAQFILYEQYKKSTSDKTKAIAVQWLKSAADNGFPQAEYDYGKQLLKDKKNTEAKIWLLKAQEHGIAAANSTLGSLYYNEKKYAEAYPFLNTADTATARYQLATMFERGLGVETDYYRAYMLYKEANRLGLKNTQKDIARVDKKKSEREQAHYDAAKRKEGESQKELIERCGDKASHQNIRTAGNMIHLNGFSILPLENSGGFIVHTEKGIPFFVVDAERQANIAQFQNVDITARSTGKSLTVSSDNDSTVTVYQLAFEKDCRL